MMVFWTVVFGWDEKAWAFQKSLLVAITILKELRVINFTARIADSSIGFGIA
jgi:hypothetical protein